MLYNCKPTLSYCTYYIFLLVYRGQSLFYAEWCHFYTHSLPLNRNRENLHRTIYSSMSWLHRVARKAGIPCPQDSSMLQGIKKGMECFCILSVFHWLNR